MPKITYIDSRRHRSHVEGEIGSTVMETAIKNGVPGIEAECGGACACATCHVYVDEAWRATVGEPSPMEEDMLDFGYDVQPNSRLSCQIKVTRRARRPGRAHARAAGLITTRMGAAHAGRRTRFRHGASKTLVNTLKAHPGYANRDDK